MKPIVRFLLSDEGATAVECAVLVGLVLLACITAIMLVGQWTAVASPEPQPAPSVVAPSDG